MSCHVSKGSQEAESSPNAGQRRRLKMSQRFTKGDPKGPLQGEGHMTDELTLPLASYTARMFTAD